ncbi:MAG: DUF1122 domain-containing protein [Dehalococcoidia bacterium]|nr:DUF1122 domain-containing protein [Dehalococcoidia bacterium]
MLCRQARWSRGEVYRRTPRQGGRCGGPRARGSATFATVAGGGRYVTNVDGPGRWTSASVEPEHPLSRLDGAEVGQGVTLEVELGSRNQVGARYFRAFLRSDDLGRTTVPVVTGLANQGPYPAYNWVDVTDFEDHLPLDDGREVVVPEAIDLRIIGRLAELVPPGGHLMAEYDSPSRSSTARALAARVPPAATPLGAMLFAVSCGVAFKDWYISEGGREGPRKLQGFRALGEAHERQRAPEMLESLEAFMGRSKDLDWDLQARTRPLAEAAIMVLRARLGLSDGPLA